MTYFAHTKQNKNGETEFQTLKDHLMGTANYAAEALSSIGLKETAFLAGVLHDMGKYTDRFQNYLLSGDSGKRGSVIHTFQGCRYLLEHYHLENNSPDYLASELLAYAIASHHGLIDCINEVGESGLKYRLQKEDTDQKSAEEHFFEDSGFKKEDIDRLFVNASKEIDELWTKINEANDSDEEFDFIIGMLARLIAAALMEGDRRDTAEFISGCKVSSASLDIKEIWKNRRKYLEAKLSLLPTDSPINNARRRISDICASAASEQGGLVRLTAPTGGGKTLAVLRYAEAHAELHDKKRIIFVAPLLSIIEQNAKVIREYVGDDNLILEHHSNVIQTEKSTDCLDESELLVQSWDTPIIVTTLVQLLNTMFDGRTTSVRRFHSLCNSIIVIDEVQSVPTKMLTLFNLTISFLSEYCRTTVVLCSATQPALESSEHHLKKAPKEILSYDKKLWETFERTEIIPIAGRRMEEFPELIIDLMDGTQSLLVVCNKKTEALKLYKNTLCVDYRSFHLSAAMCMEHRRNVANEMFKALERKEKVLCVSTQVIEAGIDISFEKVLRLTAGMDSIVQAAGRCNRNGESVIPGKVYIAECTDESLRGLEDIQRGKTVSIELIDSFIKTPDKYQNNLASCVAIEYYYKKLYSEMNKGAQDFPVSNYENTLFDFAGSNIKFCLSSHDADAYDLRQAFKTAGKEFKVFDEDMIDVIVPFGKGKKLIEELGSARACVDNEYKKRLIRESENYAVSIHRLQLNKMIKNGAITAICNARLWVLLPEYYDDNSGFASNPNQLEYLEVSYEEY